MVNVYPVTSVLLTIANVSKLTKGDRTMLKKALMIVALALSVFAVSNTRAIEPMPDCYPCPDVR